MVKNYDGGADRALVANTASANVELTDYSRGIYIGESGNLDVQMLDDVNVTFANVVGGTILPIRVKTIFSSSTANSIVVVW